MKPTWTLTGTVDKVSASGRGFKLQQPGRPDVVVVCSAHDGMRLEEGDHVTMLATPEYSKIGGDYWRGWSITIAPEPIAA